ncbi:MAG: DNA polymerase III subunit delta [Rickettsiales bacterium]|jgi:DNA polymerase-3 subunit delta|nr:DNA polymerase III subunit delta [Rickettsiales bacterium]
MKLKESDFNGILKNNLAGIPAVLIYGPDNGKIGDFIDKIIEKLGIQSDNLVSVDGASLRDKFDSIYSDACSASMFGGDKLVLVHNPDGRDLPLLQNLCGSAVAPVLIADGELEAKNTLRKFFEDHEKFAALPLYADDEQSLGVLIRKTLSDLGITKIDPDAMGYMFQHLGRDRQIARGFLKKIALYVDDKKTVSLDDVEKCLPDTGAANMDEFKFALTAGNITQTLRAMDRLFAENLDTTFMARVLGGHFKDLLNCVAGGQMPRIFWKYQNSFDAARKIWPESDLSAVLIKLNKLESDMRGRIEPEILFRDFSLKLAARAYKLAMTRKKK